MAKYNIYAVAYGIDPKTQKPVSGLKLKTWDECKSYITGVTDARYKGFLTDSEADEWLKSKVKTTNNKYIDDVPEKSDKYDEKYDIHFEFGELCKKLNLSSSDVVVQLKKQFIDFHKSMGI